MEKESVKLLSEIVGLYVNDKETQEIVQQLARQILNIETVAKAQNKKFNLKDIVSKDRQALQGIFHENGYEIASDGHILSKIKADYDTELEGKIINPKNGEEISAKYPDYKAVFNGSKSPDKVTLNFESVKEVEQKQQCDKKLGIEGYNIYICKIGESYFRIKETVQLTRFMKAYGLSEVHFTKGNENSFIYAEATDGSCTLITPLYPSNEVVKKAVDCNIL